MKQARFFTSTEVSYPLLLTKEHPFSSLPLTGFRERKPSRDSGLAFSIPRLLCLHDGRRPGRCQLGGARNFLLPRAETKRSGGHFSVWFATNPSSVGSASEKLIGWILPQPTEPQFFDDSKNQKKKLEPLLFSFLLFLLVKPRPLQRCVSMLQTESFAQAMLSLFFHWHMRNSENRLHSMARPFDALSFWERVV